MRHLYSVVAVALLLGCSATGLPVREPPDAGESMPVPPIALAPASTPRLISESQYTNTIVALFGPDFALPTALAPVKRTQGMLAVGSSSAVVTPGALDRLETAARKIAAKAIDPTYRNLLVPCRPARVDAPDPACAKEFVFRMGRLLFRRPLTASEVNANVAIANQSAEKLNDFYLGVGEALVSLMIAPDFLFIREFSQPVHNGTARLTPGSKATRLSLLLWDAYPDDELLTAVENGSLATKRGLDREVERMLASPRLEFGVRALFTDMLHFDQFANLSKDPTIYPTFTGKVSADAMEQTLRMVVDHLVTHDLDYRDLFTSRKTFLSPELGILYRLPVSKPNQWVEYEFPEGSPRAGLLTNIGMLALYSHPGRSSPTRRGRALRELLLCQPVPDPPPNVDFSLFEDSTQKVRTARERLAVHSTNPVCAGCHKITDPIGLGLENFDGAGQFRAEEGGMPIDASGALGRTAFTNADGLGRALRNDPALPTCFISRVTAFSLGRAVGSADSQWLKFLESRFTARGYRMKPLLRAIASSEVFFTVPAESPVQHEQ